MLSAKEIVVNPENEWRLKAPSKPESWARDVKPGAAKKYFMVTCDSHINQPVKLFHERLDKKWHHLLPSYKKIDGVTHLLMEGMRPAPIVDFDYQGEDALRVKVGSRLTDISDDGIPLGEERIKMLEMDGVDAQICYPNGAAIMAWSSSDIDFVEAQLDVYNDWVWEACKDYTDRMKPAAGIVTADVDKAVAQVERVAKMGFTVLCLPCKPIYGPPNVNDINYNLPMFDPLWEAIQDYNMPITFHGGNGSDPRISRGNGGAIINYCVHAMPQGMEPIVNMCASGMFERFPKLKVATIEGGAGWVPWLLEKMDEAYLKHHFWVRPKLKELPSQYYRNNCYASLGEDHSAIAQVEKFGLENNFFWENDFPHHEGAWPHSAEAIYRTFTSTELKEDTRAKILGLNAAKVFGFPIPDKYL